MATDASNVNVAVTGGVYFAPLATALPVDTTTALAVAFLEVGFLGEDGVTQSIGDSNTAIKAWQNASVVRRIQTEHTLTFKFTMIETNANSLAAYYGTYAAGVAQIKAGVLAHRVWVLHVIDGTDLIRIVVPDGQITERGDVSYVNGAEIGYPVTLECFPEDTTEVKAYVYLATAGTP
jgi:hypothetical protein